MNYTKNKLKDSTALILIKVPNYVCTKLALHLSTENFETRKKLLNDYSQDITM